MTTTTIQKTSKPIKAQLAAAWLIMALGAIMCLACSANDSPVAVLVGVLLLLAGFIGWLVTQVRRWWHHG